jgi:serine/threonine-protein kinase
VVGETLGGRYQVLRRLGGGGMGSVYEARHTGTGRRVAVKVISSELLEHPGVLRRFELEARAAGAIESQHIAQVLDVGVDEASRAPYLVMEYLLGEDLDQLHKRLGALAPELVARIAAQACVGLARAHEARIIHRDIKPANLFLSERDGGERLLKLLDFGIAKARLDDGSSGASENLTRTGSLLGTPLFMSPEQARGSKELDARSDIWSLGVVMYHALTGRAPHQDTDALGELIIRICTEEAPRLQTVAPHVPAPLAEIVHKALRIPAANRYASAEEMLAALQALLPGGFAIHASMLTLEPRALDPASVLMPTPAPVSSQPPQVVVAVSGAGRDDGGPDALSAEGPTMGGETALPRGSTNAGVTSSPGTTSPGAGRPSRAVAYGAAAVAALALAATAYVVSRSGASPDAARAVLDTPARHEGSPPLPAASVGASAAAEAARPAVVVAPSVTAASAPGASESASVAVGTTAPPPKPAPTPTPTARAAPTATARAAKPPPPSSSPPAPPPAAPATPAPRNDDPTSHM